MKLPLGDLATVRTAAIFRDAAPKETPDGNVHALAIRDLLGSWPVAPSNLPRLTVPNDLLHHCLKGGEVLIPSRGDYYQAKFYESRSDAVFPIGQINIIQPGSDLDGRYLAWYLNQDDFQRQISTKASGTNIKALTKRSLLELQIVVPPINAQVQIANLQALWEQISARRIELAELEERNVAEICTYILRKSTEAK